MGKQVQNLFDKSFLITGATGFIGANLARRLVKEAAEVHILTRQQSNKWRIQDILHNILEHQADLQDYERLQKIMFDIKPKIIFHCAAYGGYAFQEDINKIVQTNIIGIVNLVNSCLKAGFDCFVNTGSSSEYGLKSQPMSEKDLPEPINNYGVFKASATLFCQCVALTNKIPIVTLRPFSPYGYYEESTRLVSSTIISCLLGKNPKLSSRDCVRDFIFIEDVVDAYIQTANSPNVTGRIFNIGSSKQHSIGEVVDKIVKLTGNKVKPMWDKIPKRPNEPNTWVADISKAKKDLNWEPKYDLNEGLSETVKWFEKNIPLYKEAIQKGC